MDESPSDTIDEAQTIVSRGARNRRNDKLASIVAREVVHDIVSQNLQPGTKLPPEGIMLQKYDIGRASLREALRILEINGLIRIKPGPGGGPIVSGVQSDNFGRMLTLYYHVNRSSFRELLEARMAMEPLLARLAARRSTPSQTAALLADQLNETRQQIDADYADWVDAAQEFHILIAGLSGNGILSLFTRGLRDIYAGRVTEVIHDRESRLHTVEHHEDVARAIGEGDEDRAEELMRAHMQEYHDFFVKNLPGLLEEIVDWR